MSDDKSVLMKIRANAALVLKVARDELGQDVDYDLAGVSWLDGFIQRQHEQGREEQRDGLVSTLGSYLGECVVQTFGGEWAEKDGSWCVRFDDRNAVFPFAKVAKHLESGAGDSVLSFFTLIPVVFAKCLKG
ncbi:hypothetical protein WME90_11290 [Sorangium sp. So ce375]|uniref:hypothetical protein n=1 Tax=Sorangium sp. So ce375 TaxID=3133306 RepID=UPI003F5B9339